MTLHAYRSQRVEDLVRELAALLAGSWPDDPFAAVPIVVGSRGMERWLRHELATLLGSVAQIDFLFPRSAFEETSRALLGDAPATKTSDAWTGATLTTRVLSRMRARLHEPAFDRVRRYLGDGEGCVRARELAFAQEVSGTLERLLHDRPDDALAWVAPEARGRLEGRVGGKKAPPAEHAWLAALLSDLHAEIDEPSPAQRLASLRALPPSASGRSLIVFGLSTLRPGDKQRLAALARHVDLHVFALAPSSEWWEDIRSRRTVLAALRVARTEDEIHACLAELDRRNLMLAANGAPSRDLQLWLEDTEYREPNPPGKPPPPSTLLGLLHGWIDEAADNPEPGAWRAHAGCASLEVHACHGPLRQCEALRDELLRRFAADPTLEPRHVLVMTPDVATYAPLLAAVFARKSEGTPSIPLHIADLGLRATNPVADALLQALELADERVTASRLLDLLALRPVRARFGLDDDDLGDLRGMIVDSGIRWAWSAADRKLHDQPELDQNTVRFGLERLALGVLMHDEGGLIVLSGDGLGPAAPLEVATRDRVERFGRLAQACRTLESVRDRVAGPASIDAWRGRLRALLDDLTLVEGNAAWLRVQVDETLDELLPEGAGAGLELDRSAITALARGAFDLPQHGDRPVTGAVTVCALEPMRSVPFRVVAMVGLDDGAFPRAGRAPAWDPFAAARYGEYDRRTVDRHLFLEAVLCARDALLLFGTGFEPKRGAHAPLSVVASELLEVVAAAVGGKPDDLLVRHPLQPWSVDLFADERRRPFDRLWVDAATAMRGERTVFGLGATPLDATWPEEENAADSLSAEQLAFALTSPQKELLGKRLRLALEAEDAAVPDREPIEHDTLEVWSIRERALRALERHKEVTVDSIEARLRAEGVLPLQAGGRKALEDCMRDARSARERAERLAGGPVEELQLACEVDGVTLSAIATDVRAVGDRRDLVWTTASKKPNLRSQLIGWITLLVACASDRAVRAAWVVGCNTTFELRAPAAEAARTHLRALVFAWKAARRGPLLLFPSLSCHALAGRRDHPQLPARTVVLDTRERWEGAPFMRGDVTDPWVSALFGHLSIEDLGDLAETLLENAEAVWGPLLDARSEA
ncbi:MAG: exodeoxyribonuclease V subunit gamma [Deltaproteobacteria bacterium]|nr:exodeoxyribonuclease V subunit gamma [Deltaproteobacteria bacterium]